MHREAREFIKSVKAEYPEFFTGRKVLEVGSLDINGTVRQFFEDCDYHGIDLGPGPGVNEIAHVTKLETAIEYDVVISTEALEHDEQWAESLKVMYRLLQPNGLLLITCAAPNRWEHGTQRTDGDKTPFVTDYYRNISVEDFASVLLPNLFSKSYLGYRGDMEDLYFAGIKQGASAAPTATSVTEYKSYLLDTSTPEVKQRPTVTVEVSTLNRYFTTLPITLASIAMQTWKPDRLVIYDDGEQNELREIEPYTSLFHLLNDLGIPFETFKTPRLGLAANHQHVLENATTDFVLRVDDDHLLEPRTIEILMRHMTEDDQVGAVAPLVHHPGNVQPLPPDVTGKVEDVFRGVNMQWYRFNSGPRETEHLYSCYLYRVEAARKAGGYPNLSPVSFREDTWFSMKIARAGYKLVVTPFTTVHHLQQQSGGIRSFSDGSLWAQDDAKWREWLESCGVEDKSPKLICADMGLGDHLLLRSILPTLKERHKERGLTLAVCYPEVFENEDVELISIAEAQQRLGPRFEESNLYRWCAVNNRTSSLTESMLQFWG